MRRLAAVAVGAAVAMTVAACGSDGSTAASAGSAGTATVKLSYIPYTGTAPLMLGIKQGIFAQHHIKLQLTKSPAEASNFQAANTASLKYANDHIKDALATLPSFLSMTPEQAAKQVPGSIYDPTFDMASVQKQMDEMVQFKFIPKALPIADVVYKSGS
jgi:hypothetical protein